MCENPASWTPCTICLKTFNFSTHYLENLSTLLVNKFYRISLWTFAVNTSCFGHWFHFFWIPLNFRELLSFIKEQVLVSEEKLSTFNVNTLYFWTPLTLFWKPLNFFLKLKKRGGQRNERSILRALNWKFKNFLKIASRFRPLKIDVSFRCPPPFFFTFQKKSWEVFQSWEVFKKVSKVSKNTQYSH